MSKNIMVTGSIIIIALIIVILYIEHEKSKLSISIAGTANTPIQNVYVTNNITVQYSQVEYSIGDLIGEQIAVGDNNTIKQTNKSYGNL